MYDVSEEYRETIHSEIFRTKLTFTIDNATYTDENILQGSLQLTNQCTDTKDVKLGAVYVAELTATLRKVNVARNLWRGKQITLTHWLQTDEDNDIWEAVPLGVFTISEAQWKASGVVIRAYDNMQKFDKPFSLNQSGGLLYDFLAYASTECDVALAQTEQELKALPNGTQFFSYFSASDVETWRDLISYIAQVYGGFATIDRTGKLVIKRYGGEAVDDLPTSSRHTGGTFSDYVTKYTAVSYVDIEAKEVRRLAAAVDDGITLALGSNPFLQNRQQAGDALPNILAAVQQIQYTPFSFTMASNPAYDLGDVVTCAGGIAGNSTNYCCIQKYIYAYHKKFTISGYGADPATASARSKTDKSIAGLSASTSADAMGFYEFRNVQQIHIDAGVKRRVVTMRIASTAETRVHFHFNINLRTTDNDANSITYVTATYIVDGAEQDVKPEETYIDGKHVMHLMYVLPMLPNAISILTLYLTAASGTIDIERGGLWAYASGAGLVGDEEWNGILDLYDDANDFAIAEIVTFKTAAETITTNLQVPMGATLTDAAEDLAVQELQYTEALTDAVRVVNYEDEALRVTEDGEDVRTTEDGDNRFTEKEHS